MNLKHGDIVRDRETGDYMLVDWSSWLVDYCERNIWALGVWTPVRRPTETTSRLIRTREIEKVGHAEGVE